MATLQELYTRASEVLPGGVNSSIRLNRAIGTPLYTSRSEGPYVWDVEGRKLIDMCCAHGAALLGHKHPAVVAAVQKAIEMGFLSCFETEYHERLARKLCELIPCADKVRFCSSGSEATLHLIRVCRAFTGRKKIIRFEGHFHGYHELIYIGGQPPEAAFPSNRSKPYIESPGIPEEFADLIIPVPFNDPEALKKAIRKHGEDTALVILEPVNYNSGCIKPEEGFLRLLRELTQEAGIILNFDEVQSAFKKSAGGAQTDFGIIPDVCTIGKALGGGLPLSAFCGRAEIMNMYKPVGNVQHSGTFNAHLIPVLAGLAFLEEVVKPEFYSHLQNLEKHLHGGLDELIRRHELNMVVPHHGARFNFILGRKTPAIRYEDTFCHDRELMLKICRGLWQRGVYFHDYGGGAVHHGYSVQHMEKDIDDVLGAFEDTIKDLKTDLQK